MKECPDIGELERLSEGAAEETGDRDLRGHVDGCSSCAGRIREISENMKVATMVRRAAGESAPHRGVPGQIGIYRILGEVGRGGMGIVYEAEDPTLDRRVALKLLRTDTRLVSPDRLARFRKEAQLLASLNHPNLATIYSLEQSDGFHFLTMELVRGEDLARRIQGRPLPVEAALLICRQIGKALEAAHARDIIHRDLKPHNVIAPESGPVKVLDFGIAKAFTRDPDPGDEPEGLLGTPGFMSPEQLRGWGVDHRSDIWAFGCILYECLTGVRPFEGATPAQRIEATLHGSPDWDLPQEVPGPVAKLVRRCLRTDPGHRPRDMKEAVSILESELARPVFLDGRPPRAPGGAGNLPRHVSSFIGRDREMAALRGCLAESRLVSLIGSGGCGKSRLAVEAALSLGDAYPDGIWLVELASVTDADSVPRRVAGVLNVQDEKGRAVIETLVARLGSRNLLVLLDNCEHLMTSCAETVQRILEETPAVRFLITSREALGLAGERIVPVPPLDVPGEGDDLETVGKADAVRLFAARVDAVIPGFSVDEQNVDSVRQICRRLDGVPLAIELAAARTRLLSPAEISRHLDDRFRLLSGGSRAALPRHQTLQASIDWSISLLADPERKVLERLSVFSGGWTLNAAEVVCSEEDVPRWEVFDCFSRLLNKSLVEREEEDAEGGASRYRMLESIRHYALDRLSASGSGEATRRRHRDHFLALAREAEPHLTGPEQKEWTRRLSREHENLLGAIEFSLDREDPDAALEMAGCLGRFWANAGRWTEGREIFGKLLDRTQPGVRSLAHIKCLNWAGNLAQYQGHYEVAREYLEKSLELCRATGQRWYEASAHNNLGAVARFTGDLDAAEGHHLRALGIREELGDGWAIGLSLLHLGSVAARRGDYDEALPHLCRSLDLVRMSGDRFAQGSVLIILGTCQLGGGDPERALRTLQESLRVFQEGQDPWGIALSHHHLARVDLACDRTGQARQHLRESLGRREALGDRQAVMESLAVLAELAVSEGDPEEAVRFLGAAQAIRDGSRIAVTPLERADLERIERRAARTLGPGRLGSLRHEGETWTFEEAVRRALAAVA